MATQIGFRKLLPIRLMEHKQILQVGPGQVKVRVRKVRDNNNNNNNNNNSVLLQQYIPRTGIVCW